MSRKKAAAVTLGAISACSLLGGVISYAGNNDTVQTNASLQNGFISLTVEQDKDQLEYLKFHLDTTEGRLGNTADNDKNFTYRNFYSGYTTINIDGKNYIYGQGEDVSEPKYDVDNKCHISSQRFGDVVIQQKLTFAEGYTEGYEDMLEISYKVLESNPNNAVGVRVLIDPMIGDDDMLSLYVKDVNIKSEALMNNTVPEGWTAEMRNDQDVVANGKLSGADPMPSSVLFANWDNVYDVLWDYKPSINDTITDAAAAVIWEPVTDSRNTEFKTYYGVKNHVEMLEVTTEDVAPSPDKSESTTSASSGSNNKKPSNNASLSSPQTGSSFPKGVIALFAVSAVSAGASLILSRKDKKNAE